MPTPNLTNAGESIITSNDSIVIVDNFQSIRGGRSLDTTGFTGKVLKAGLVIIKETSSGNYKPMPTIEPATAGVNTFGAVVPGSGYTNGTYTNVPLAGGTGIGARGTIVVAGGVISTITKTEPGSGYTVGDSLTGLASVIGAGSGGSFPVATVADVTGAYTALPAGHTYAGILIASILTAKPFAGILVRGTVNPAASPYDLTTILAAVKTALPLIDFRQD